MAPRSRGHPPGGQLQLASAKNAPSYQVIQQMLGQRSATMTLHLYGRLFESRLTDVAERLDAAARAVAGLSAFD